MKRPTFLFHTEWKEVLSDCTPEVRLEVYDAIIEYAASGTLSDLKPVAKIAFSFIKKMIDEDNMKAAELRRKRSEGGKKGMANRYNSVNSVITQPNSLSPLITQPNKETPSKEMSPIPPKEYTPKESVDNNNISSLRTREERELEKFDSLLQEVVDGKYQIWEDQMRKKFGIDNVIDYLPSFRDHAIANSKVTSVGDTNEFKRYFVNSFRYFTKSNPIEMLTRYRENSQSEKFIKYCDWVKSKASNVTKGIVPLTEEELNNLTDAFGSKAVFNAILDLNNREDLISKYFSLYRTLINWLEKDRV